MSKWYCELMTYLNQQCKSPCSYSIAPIQSVGGKVAHSFCIPVVCNWQTNSGTVYNMLIRLFHFVTLMIFSYYCSTQLQRSEATAMVLSRGDTIWEMILSNGDLDLVFPAITESLGQPMVSTPLWGARIAVPPYPCPLYTGWCENTH